MQVIVPNKTLFYDCSPEEVGRQFPYLKERLDAIKKIKEFDKDLRRISNHGRMITRGGSGSDMVRIGSLPMHVCIELKDKLGMQFFLDPYMQEQFFKANPGWSTIYG